RRSSDLAALHDRGGVGDRRVVAVADDAPPVAAALVVAPLDQRLDGLAHLLVQTWRTHEAAVVAVPDGDLVGLDALVGRAAAVAVAAGGLQVAPRGGRVDSLGRVVRRRGRVRRLPLCSARTGGERQRDDGGAQAGSAPPAPEVCHLVVLLLVTAEAAGAGAGPGPAGVRAWV